MTTTTPARRRRNVAAVVRALFCLLVVLALVGGLPVLLWHATTATWGPGVEALSYLLTRQDTSAVFLLVLTALGWAGWAAFTLSLVVEVPAQLRGLRAPHLPGLGAGQRAAATLISGILILLPIGTALASPTQATTTVSAPQATGTPAVTDTAAAAQPAPARQEAPTYTVREMRPAESLWSIAEEQLGDGARYTEIADLNTGREMADGRTFHVNSPIQPGWKLRMPAPPAAPDTSVPAPRPQGEPGQGASYTVVAGDTLTGIAETELGDADRYTEIYTANKSALADPDHIYTGQHLTLPTAQGTPAEKPAPEHPAPSPNDPDDEVSEPSVKPTPQPQPAEPVPPKPSAPASATPAPPTSSPAPSATPDREAEVPVPAKTTPAPAPSSTPGTTGQSTRSASSLDMQTVAGTGAFLAGSAVTALALRRMLQRRRRKPGQNIALTETGTTEQLLGAVAAQASPQTLDHALRVLAHRAADEGRQVPVLRAAAVTSRTVAVLPDDLSAEPAPPFAAGTAGWWELPASAELPDGAREMAPPCPGLVTLGSRADGSLLLLNLPQTRCLLVDGSPAHIEEVHTSIALELSQSPWAGAVEILVVGFGAELPGLLPTSRIRYVGEPAHAVRDLAERAIEVHQDDSSIDAGATVRPWILLVGGDLTSDDAWALADALGTARSVPACMVLPAKAARAYFPDADILDADRPATEPQPLAAFGEQVRVQRMARETYADILEALAVTGEPAQGPEGTWQEVPAEPLPAATTPGPVRVNGSRSAAATDPGAVAGIFPSLLAAAGTPATPPAAPAEGTPHEAPATKAPGTAEGSASKPAEEEEAAADEEAPPMLRVLGAIEVSGISSTGHGPKLAHLTALLHLRPGRDGASIREAMDPLSPWSDNTFTSRLTELRAQLASAPDGKPYLPRRRAGDPYTLHPQFSCDWHRFLHLAETGLSAQKLELLDQALNLVRGRPFGHHAPTWAYALQQEMITRIVDVAHTSAHHHTHNGSYDQARKALAVGMEVDESAELLARDLLRLEDAVGSATGIRRAITMIQRVNRALEVSMEPETEHLITQLLAGTGR